MKLLCIPRQLPSSILFLSSKDNVMYRISNRSLYIIYTTDHTLDYLGDCKSEQDLSISKNFFHFYLLLQQSLTEIASLMMYRLGDDRYSS